MAGAIARWFKEHARELPWRNVDPRTGRRDPYRSLVSEIMLQQTQVSRVIDKFSKFVALFPTVNDLARADEHAVLAAWTGLGYYRRARALHAAARMIVERFGGAVPCDVEHLIDLPGVGRYTAGAIASMVFEKPEPIVDGNVVRVLFRIHGKDLTADDPAGISWAWQRAGELVSLSPPALFNEGMMELGATVCTPASADCGRCPVRRSCEAHREGSHGRIPRAKAAARQRNQWHTCVVIRDPRGRVLLERRQGVTLWDGLWQVPTVETARIPTPDEPTNAKGLSGLGKKLGIRLRPIGSVPPEFEFKTSACRVHFRVLQASLIGRVRGPGRRWATQAQAKALPMSSPMRRILSLD